MTKPCQKKRKKKKSNKTIVEDSIVLLAQEKTAPSSSSHPDDNCENVCVCVCVIYVGELLKQKCSSNFNVKNCCCKSVVVGVVA